MLNLLLADSGNFFTKYGYLIIIVILLAAFMIFTFFRRKKEDSYYNDLNAQIKPGANVKTRSGIYGKVVSITETTDGKIVLLETGEGNKVSYQNIHIDAIFALDTKQPVVYDKDGGIILPEEMNEKALEQTVQQNEVVSSPEKKSTKTTKPVMAQDNEVLEASTNVIANKEKPAAKSTKPKTATAKTQTSTATKIKTTK